MRLIARRIRNKSYHILTSLHRILLVHYYGMNIGKGTRIARTSRLDKANPAGIHIGSNTAVAFQASILSHDFVNLRHVDTRIGSNCFIGARSIILPGVTIGDNCIIGAGSVVMSDIPSNTIAAGNPARIIRSGIQTREYGVLESDANARQKVNVDEGIPSSGKALGGSIIDFIKQETGADDKTLMEPLGDTGIDSFTLITLRTAIEERYSVSIPDSEWSSVQSLGQIAHLQSLENQSARFDAEPPAVVSTDMRSEAVDPPPPPTILPRDRYEQLTHQLPEGRPASMVESRVPGHLHRRHVLEMSKMALSGMGEPWLFRELNDLHWAMICDFLRVPSSQITDGQGDRLYATITRCSIDFKPDLYSFKENTALDIRSDLQRYGASMFFSNHRFEGSEGVSGHASVMSTFAKYGERGNNKSLKKGSPNIVDQQNVPSLSDLPSIAAEYRKKRAEKPSEIILSEVEYEILPPHDINGVGLLYFAAYPIIFDLCIDRIEELGFLRNFSTVSKDIMYFSNSEPNDTLIFRLHARETIGSDHIRHFCSLSRKSDGVRMAEMTGVKRRVI